MTQHALKRHIFHGAFMHHIVKDRSQVLAIPTGWETYTDIKLRTCFWIRNTTCWDRAGVIFPGTQEGDIGIRPGPIVVTRQQLKPFREGLHRIAIATRRVLIIVIGLLIHRADHCTIR
ncbi:hypothetical protein D3C84_1052040 [compost metagenome]